MNGTARGELEGEAQSGVECGDWLDWVRRQNKEGNEKINYL